MVKKGAILLFFFKKSPEYAIYFVSLRHITFINNNSCKLCLKSAINVLNEMVNDKSYGL